jgi:hypothetical protein
LSGIRDFGLDGQPLVEFRARGLFEASQPARRTFRTPDGVVQVTSDQLLQAIFCVGEPLDPGHVFGVLLWFGAVNVDGGPPDAETLRTLLDAEPGDDRLALAGFHVGPPSDDPGILAFQRLLYTLYRAWAIDCQVWVDA